MAGFPRPQTDSIPPGRSSAKPPELLTRVSNDFLREMVQKAVKSTNATGGAIALGHPELMICRATAGECPSEIIGTKIDPASGLTGVCVASGMIQFCANTKLDARVDADACQELGVAAIVVAPLFCQDQLLGLIEVFSRRPYAFGMRDLQTLEALAEGFCANLRLSAESTNGTVHEVRSVSDTLGGERNQHHFARILKISFYAAVVVACFLIGLRWRWKLTDPMANSAKGHITLISTVPVVSPQVSHSHLVEGALLYRVDPTYPEGALRQRVQGQVVLQIRIGKDGFVYDTKVIRGDPMLSRAALEAVRQWRFTPYAMNKEPFDLAAQITFEFSLVK
jgi:TonB family protein